VALKDNYGQVPTLFIFCNMRGNSRFDAANILKAKDLLSYITYEVLNTLCSVKTAERAEGVLAGTLSQSCSQRNNLKPPFCGTVQVGGQGCRK
jgi:hypothetical protein